MHLLSTSKEAADACGVQGSSDQTWLSAPRSWSRGLAQHKYQKSSATTRSAKAVMQKTIAAAMRTAAVMSRYAVNCLKDNCFSTFSYARLSNQKRK